MKRLMAVMMMVMVSAAVQAVSNEACLDAIGKAEVEAKEEALLYVVQIRYHKENTVIETSGGLFIVVKGTWLLPKYAKVRGGGKKVIVDGNELTVIKYLFARK